MPTESPGKIQVKGRFGSIQAVTDGVDTQIAVPAGAANMEIHQLGSGQTLWYSFTGAVNSWEPVMQRPTSTQPFRVVLVGGPAIVYFRKAYSPRLLQPRPELTTLSAKERLADDQILTVHVTFTS